MQDSIITRKIIGETIRQIFDGNEQIPQLLATIQTLTPPQALNGPSASYQCGKIDCCTLYWVQRGNANGCTCDTQNICYAVRNAKIERNSLGDRQLKRIT